MSNSNQVIIAGGGPVGLISAYALAQRGISVTILEQNDSLQDDPRAATTHPATLEILVEHTAARPERRTVPSSPRAAVCSTRSITMTKVRNNTKGR